MHIKQNDTDRNCRWAQSGHIEAHSGAKVEQKVPEIGLFVPGSPFVFKMAPLAVSRGRGWLGPPLPLFSAHLVALPALTPSGAMK